MTKARVLQLNKIQKMTEKRKMELIEQYSSMHAEEIASYYNMMGQPERDFIDNEVLSIVAPDYKEKVQFYINHPLELRDKLNRLEKKADKKPETYTNNICTKCYHMQETCCADEPRVPFTLADVERLTALGHKLEDFAIAGEYTPEDIDEDEDWWKKGMIEVDGKFYRLNVKQKANGSCHFLDETKGCTLGKDRPPVCKIYPFWLNDKDEIIYEERKEISCFIQKMEHSIEFGMREIGETPESIRKYFDEIKRDFSENREQHKGLILRLLNQQ